MSHEFIDTDKMALPAPAAGLGVWENVQVPDDGDERKAAILGVGLEAVAERTTWLRHRGVIVEPFGITIPSLTNSGATVGGSNGFSVKKAVAINTLVPATTGYTAPLVWRTPTVPFEINRAYIRLTGASTANATPGAVTLDLALGSRLLVTGQMSTYLTGLADPLLVVPINGSTTNKSIFGVHASERGALLDGTMTDTGKDYLGAASVAGALVCYTNVLASEFFNQPVTVRVRHSAVGPITLTFQLEVVLSGQLH